MDKKQAFCFLDQLQGQGIKLGLERVQEFLDLVGNPEKSFKSVHVAGTNGKGSTAAMIERILREAGYKTGLYTSPHLVRFNERIQVNGKQIKDKQIAKLVTELKGQREQSKIAVTYFEFITAMAFKHFADEKADFALIEVGMGGRLDATNVIKPLVSVITNVENEHEKHLGQTVEKIAAEKAGVIKKGIATVTAEWKKKALAVIRDKCREEASSLTVVKKPFEGKLKMLGSFQKWNAATAVAAISEMRKQGIEISEKAVEQGLAKALWPGRFQIMQSNPTVVLDCGHNPSCCVVLARAFKELFPGKKALLVIGISEDKNIAKMARRLASIANKAFVTAADYKPMDPERIASHFEKLGLGVEVIAGVENAVRKAIESSNKEGIVLVTGSCFVVGQALEFFEKNGIGF